MRFLLMVLVSFLRPVSSRTLHAELVMQEELPLGTEVANLVTLTHLQPTDQRSSVTEWKFNFQFFNSEPSAAYFELDPSTGVIRVRQRVDRDVLCVQVGLCCEPSSPVSAASGPDFPGNQDSFSKVTKISEDASAATCVLSLKIRSDENYQVIIILNIRVQDINDHAPKFSLSEFRVQFSEGDTPRERVSLPQATDLDGAQFSVQNYYLAPVGSSEISIPSLIADSGPKRKANLEMFSVQYVPAANSAQQKSVLWLVLEAPLDRETMDRYDFTLWALDGGQPPRNASMRLTVIVTDTNDCSPEFTSKSYEARIPEDAALHREVVQVQATDKDLDANGHIVYSLNALNNPEYRRLFSMDDRTGWIRVQRELDYEAYHEISLVVEASDMGSSPRKTMATVKIILEDVNDHSPEISLEPPTSSSQFGRGHLMPPLSTVNDIFLELTENDNPGKLLAVFTIQDRDSGPNGQVECRLEETTPKLTPLQGRPTAAPSKSTVLFRMVRLSVPVPGSTMYKLLTNMPVDREATPRIPLTISCHDFGTPVRRNSSSRYIVQILDVNDVTPHFAQPQYVNRLREDQLLESSIMLVSAVDEDDGLNGTVSYSIHNCSNKVGLNLTAVSSAPSASTAEVILPCPFRINPTTGTIILQNKLDREIVNKWEFTVVAVDGGPDGGLTGSVNVTCHVSDVNDSPPRWLIPEDMRAASGFDENKFIFYVSESHVQSNPIGKLEATDADLDENAQLSFSLISVQSIPVQRGRMDEEYFNRLYRDLTTYTMQQSFIVHADGTIHVGGRQLDRELAAKHELTVRVSDKGNPALTNEAIVLIIVTDVNDNPPRFLYPSPHNYTIQITSDVPIGSTIAQLLAWDPDEETNARLQYSFTVTDSALQNIYSVDSTSGVVSLHGRLDLAVAEDHTMHLHSLQVKVEDCGDPVMKSQGLLRIEIYPPGSLPGQRLQDDLSSNKLQGPSVSLVSRDDNLSIIIAMVCATSIIICILLLIIGITLFRRHRFLLDLNGGAGNGRDSGGVAAHFFGVTNGRDVDEPALWGGKVCLNHENGVLHQGNKCLNPAIPYNTGQSARRVYYTDNGSYSGGAADYLTEQSNNDLQEALLYPRTLAELQASSWNSSTPGGRSKVGERTAALTFSKTLNVAQDVNCSADDHQAVTSTPFLYFATDEDTLLSPQTISPTYYEPTRQPRSIISSSHTHRHHSPSSTSPHQVKFSTAPSNLAANSRQTAFGVGDHQEGVEDPPTTSATTSEGGGDNRKAAVAYAVLRKSAGNSSKQQSSRIDFDDLDLAGVKYI